MGDFRPLLGRSPAEGFEALDLGAVDDDGFEPIPGFRAPERADLPERSGEWSVAAEGEDPAAATFDEETPPSVEEIGRRTGEHAAVQSDDVAALRARTEGFEIGRREGLQAGAAEVAEQVRRLAALASQLEEARRELFARSIGDLAAAVMHIAAEIVRRELSIDSDGVERLVTTILGDVRSDDEVVVRVGEQDAELMREAYPAMLELVGRDGMVRLEIDRGLAPGGAVVETTHGTIDASVEAQLASFAEAVEAWAKHEREALDD